MGRALDEDSSVGSVDLAAAVRARRPYGSRLRGHYQFRGRFLSGLAVIRPELLRCLGLRSISRTNDADRTAVSPVNSLHR